MNILEISKNFNCSTLLLWVLKIDYGSLKKNNIQNTFLYDENRPYENCLYLLFKPDNIYDFNSFVELERKRTHLLIDEYECGAFSILVYKLPSEYNKDYERFYQGKYSEFSPKFKSNIPQTFKIRKGFGVKDEVNLSYMIVNQDKVLKNGWTSLIGEDIDKEVWPVPNLEREKLKIYELCTEST